MKDNRIVCRQFAFMTFLCMLGTAFILSPGSAAGNNSFISMLAGALIFFFILRMIIKMQITFPGVSILQISKHSLGTIIGTIFNTIYLGALFLIIILSLYDYTSFFILIFPHIPPLIIEAIIILTIININYHGVSILGRINDSLTVIVLLMAVIALIIPVAHINWSNLLPLFAEWEPIVGGTLIAANWPFGEVVLLTLLLPFVTDLQQNSRTIYLWYGIAGVIMFMGTIVVIGVLGSETVVFMRFPLFNVLRNITLAGFQRIELFFFFLWFLIEGSVINCYFTCLSVGLKESLGLKNKTVLLFPAGLLVIVMMNYMFPSDLGMLRVETVTMIFLTLPVFLLYPAVVFIAARLRRNKISAFMPPAILDDSK